MSFFPHIQEMLNVVKSLLAPAHTFHPHLFVFSGFRGGAAEIVCSFAFLPSARPGVLSHDLRRRQQQHGRHDDGHSIRTHVRG